MNKMNIDRGLCGMRTKISARQTKTTLHIRRLLNKSHCYYNCACSTVPTKDDNEHFRLNSRLMWQIEFSMGYIWVCPGKAAWPTGFMHKGSQVITCASALPWISIRTKIGCQIASNLRPCSFVHVEFLRPAKVEPRKSNRPCSTRLLCRASFFIFVQIMLNCVHCNSRAIFVTILPFAGCARPRNFIFSCQRGYSLVLLDVQ